MSQQFLGEINRAYPSGSEVFLNFLALFRNSFEGIFCIKKKLAILFKEFPGNLFHAECFFQLLKCWVVRIVCQNREQLRLCRVAAFMLTNQE
ncbi:MAG: hypothetical protein DDT28_00733 [Dehalococcoidia bacterium]|nr:hypothetical protein [Chloroflexota bacterium]